MYILKKHKLISQGLLREQRHDRRSWYRTELNMFPDIGLFSLGFEIVKHSR